MRRTFLIAAVAVVSAATACKRRDGDVACAPESLTFSRGATNIADPDGVIADVRIAPVGTGFLVVWSSGPSVDETDLWGVTVGLDGVVSSNPVRLTQASGISARVRLAPGAGGIGMSWTDGRFAQQVAMATVLTDLAPTGAPAVFQGPVIASDQEPIPAIASLGTGYVVAWNARGIDGYDHLYAQLLTTSGAAFGSAAPLLATLEDRASAPTVSVSTAGAIVADEEVRPGSSDADVFAYLVAGTNAAVARYGIASEAKAPEAIAGGVVWIDLRDGGRPDLFFAEAGGGEIRLTSGPESHVAPSVAPTSEGFFVTWLAGEEIWLRSFTSRGAPNGPILAAGTGAKSDVAWTPAGAGVVWIAPDGLSFRPLACN